jgi:hypothetical protein
LFYFFCSGEADVTLVDTTLSFQYGKLLTATMNLTNADENIYLLEIPPNSDVEAMLYMQSGSVENIPEFYIQFLDVNRLIWLSDPSTVFVRGEGLDSYPIIPWEPDSCSPVSRRFKADGNVE